MSRTTRLPYVLFAIALLAIIPANANLAQQGHSPRPEASPISTDGWHVTNTREIDVLGELITLSPDGQWIAGPGPANRICVWAVETLEETCVQLTEQPDRYAIRWSPDSTAIAWTHNSATTFADSDLHVMEVSVGTVTNLTDDQVDGHVDFQGEPSDPDMKVDLAPAWTADSQAIIFARLEWGESGATTSIYSISRAGGDPELIHRPEVDGVWAITFPMRVLSDGALLYSVTDLVNDQLNGIWHLSPGGEPRQVMPGTNDDDFPAPIVVDVLETPEQTIVSGSSLPRAYEGTSSVPVAFQLDLATGEVTPGEAGASPVTFSPDGSATVYQEPWGSIVIASGEMRLDLEYSGMAPYAFVRGIDWATNNTMLLLVSGKPRMLVTVSR